MTPLLTRTTQGDSSEVIPANLEIQSMLQTLEIREIFREFHHRIEFSSKSICLLFESVDNPAQLYIVSALSEPKCLSPVDSKDCCITWPLSLNPQIETLKFFSSKEIMLSVNVIYYFNWSFPTQAASEIENFEQFKMEKSPKKGSQEPFGKSHNCHIIYQMVPFSSLRGGGRSVCDAADSHLHDNDRHISSSLSLLCGQGGSGQTIIIGVIIILATSLISSGVWEGSHLQTGKTADGRS